MHLMVSIKYRSVTLLIWFFQKVFILTLRSFNSLLILDKPNIIVCIPAYNEENSISAVIETSKIYANDVVVVDDGSIDQTAEVAVRAGARVVRSGRNMGKGAALKRGLSECLKCQPTVVVTLDADGQHDPHEIPSLLKPIQEGQADIVIGSRFKEKTITEIPFVRSVGLSFIDKINRSLVRSSVRDSQSGFRAYSMTVLGVVTECISNGYGAETEQLAAAEFYGYRIAEVPINVRYTGLANTSKTGKFTHGADIISTIGRIVIERRPLLFFGGSGLLLIVSSIITASYLVMIFNETRYFSLPLALITIGLVMIGALLVFAAVVFYAINRIQHNQTRRF
jgi:glycosyltransferase involved in cell wall biosynthesis